jgi:xanthine dehydrogenase YagR molybdenum-binding subunit
MYAAPYRRTTHRLAPLDLPVPTIMRAPGETQGMFALESAMDEMAAACGLDPVEFRIRNEPDAGPETGRPFSSRNLVACLRDGARWFGWERRDPATRARCEGRWLVGTGVVEVPGESRQVLRRHPQVGAAPSPALVPGTPMSHPPSRRHLAPQQT